MVADFKDIPTHDTDLRDVLVWVIPLLLVAVSSGVVLPAHRYAIVFGRHVGCHAYLLRKLTHHGASA